MVYHDDTFGIHDHITDEILQLIIDAGLRGIKPVSPITQERIAKLEDFTQELEKCANTLWKRNLHGEAIQYLYWLMDQLSFEGWQMRLSREDISRWFKVDDDLIYCRATTKHY
jgi:hypothetical protein